MGRILLASFPTSTAVQDREVSENVGRAHQLAEEKQHRQHSGEPEVTQIFYFPELEALRKLYPHGHHMYDKEVGVL